MSDMQNTLDVISAEALGAEVCGTAFATHLAKMAVSPSEPEITRLVRELDRLGDFSSERASLERIDNLVASLESCPSPKPEDQNETGGFRKEYRSRENIKLNPFENGRIEYLPFWKRCLKPASYVAAFALGLGTYALFSGDDNDVSISSPEEAVAHYNRVVGAAGGRLVVPMPPGMHTPEDICYEAFSRLYGVVDPSRSHEELHLFIDSLIDAGLCTDVHPERGYYGFIPQRETPQPTER